MINILTSLHTIPNTRTYRTLFFENVLEELKKQQKVHITWLVYMPERLENIPKMEDAILDIHDYENAVEVIKKVKPDVVYVSPNMNFPDYSLAVAAKQQKIPVVGELVNRLFLEEGLTKKLIFEYLRNFFSKTIPTDVDNSKNYFMRRGRFFFYKYRFLLKTQKEAGISFFARLKDFFSLMFSHITIFKNLHQSKYAVDLHFVENESLIDTLLKNGFRKESLVVTGNPIYDTIFKKVKEIPKSNRTGKKIRILLITHAMVEHGFWSRKQRDDLIENIVKKISQNSDEMELTVKIHPSSEILSEYENIIKPIDSRISIYKFGDINEFIRDADIILAYSSESTLINALLMDKPIIICNSYNLINDIFLTNNMAIECKNMQKLPQLIRENINKNISKEKKDKFLKKYFYKIDGKSSLRISDSLIQFLGKNKSKLMEDKF